MVRRFSEMNHAEREALLRPILEDVAARLPPDASVALVTWDDDTQQATLSAHAASDALVRDTLLHAARNADGLLTEAVR